jgi:hypothetical protein
LPFILLHFFPLAVLDESRDGRSPALALDFAMTPDEELPVIRAAYEFTTWLIPKVGRFPRDLQLSP